jgi:hypothetical protein
MDSLDTDVFNKTISQLVDFEWNMMSFYKRTQRLHLVMLYSGLLMSNGILL